MGRRTYRFLDRLNDQHKSSAQQIAYQYSRRILKNISVVFYDMTSLYFEAEDEDDLRKIGFSKDGKFQNPQIMLGLLVGENGYPIGYDIFEGNTFEGKTLLPVLNGIQERYWASLSYLCARSPSRSFSAIRSRRLLGASTLTSGIQERTQRISSLRPVVSMRISTRPSRRIRNCCVGCQSRSVM